MIGADGLHDEGAPGYVRAAFTASMPLDPELVGIRTIPSRESELAAIWRNRLAPATRPTRPCRGAMRPRWPGARERSVVMDNREPVLADRSTYRRSSTWTRPTALGPPLWHAGLGPATRYGTARCAAMVQARLELDGDGHRERSGRSLNLFGAIVALPPGMEYIPWDGPRVRIVEHQAHAPGHAALLIENERVLLRRHCSDVLIPLLDVRGGRNPVEDYLDALRRLEDIASEADVFIPGADSSVRRSASPTRPPRPDLRDRPARRSRSRRPAPRPSRDLRPRLATGRTRSAGPGTSELGN